MGDQSNEKIWHAIYDVPDEEIWATRMALKKKLVDYIRDKFRETWLKNQGDPVLIASNHRGYKTPDYHHDYIFWLIDGVLRKYERPQS